MGTIPIVEKGEPEDSGSVGKVGNRDILPQYIVHI